MRHRRGDLDELLLADGQFADQPRRIDLCLDRGELFPGPAQHFAAGNERRARRECAQAEVFRDRQVLAERSSWCTMPMPAASASLGLANRAGLPSTINLAFVGRVDARQNFAERALAGAVLAAERVTGTSRDVEAHVPQRLHAGKAFADALETE